MALFSLTSTITAHPKRCGTSLSTIARFLSTTGTAATSTTTTPTTNAADRPRPAPQRPSVRPHHPRRPPPVSPKGRARANRPAFRAGVGRRPATTSDGDRRRPLPGDGGGTIGTRGADAPGRDGATLLGRDQIRRIWNRFEFEERTIADADTDDDSSGGVEGEGGGGFVLEEFLEEYPNINPALLASVRAGGGADDNAADPSPTTEGILPAPDGGTRHARHELVDDAVEKLDRMLAKVGSAELTEELVPRVRKLVVEEFETVVDLWVQVSASSSPETNGDGGKGSGGWGEAIGAAHSASALLARWEREHLHGAREQIRREDDDDDNDNGDGAAFYLPPPSTRAYQTVVDAWWRIYRTADGHTPLSDTQRGRIRDHAASLLETMTERLVSNRTHGMRYGVGIEDADRHVYDSLHPLNATYNRVVSMWTSVGDGGQTIRADRAMAAADRAASLLERMELIYHDALTGAVPPQPPSPPTEPYDGTDTDTDANRGVETELLQTIQPVTSTFDAVLTAYSRTAIAHRSLPAVEAADRVLERMERRCRAYDDSVASAPGENSYRVVTDAWRRFSSPRARSRVKDLTERMEGVGG